MKRICLLLICIAVALRGQTVPVSSPAPPAPLVTVASIGLSQYSTYYYAVVANYPAGSAPSLVVSVTRGASTLTGTNRNSISWGMLPGAVSYDVLKFPNGTFSGSCTCALATGLVGVNTFNDTGTALAAYTMPATVQPANASLYTNTRDYQTPQIRQIINGVDMSVIGFVDTVNTNSAVFTDANGNLKTCGWCFYDPGSGPSGGPGTIGIGADSIFGTGDASTAQISLAYENLIVLSPRNFGNGGYVGFSMGINVFNADGVARQMNETVNAVREPDTGYFNSEFRFGVRPAVGGTIYATFGFGNEGTMAADGTMSEDRLYLWDYKHGTTIWMIQESTYPQFNFGNDITVVASKIQVNDFLNTGPGHSLLEVQLGFTDANTTTTLINHGVTQFAGRNATAAVAGVIGSTCPAVTCTAAYTWVQAKSADGSTVYFPVWK